MVAHLIGAVNLLHSFAIVVTVVNRFEYVRVFDVFVAFSLECFSRVIYRAVALAIYRPHTHTYTFIL